MIKINQAFILAAGRGERMRPLTDKIPKPLAQIKGKTLIDYIVEKLNKISSLNKIVVNSYYLAEILEAHIKFLNNPKIIISHETKKLETGGGLVNALPLFDKTQPILIINSDLLWLDEENNLIKKMVENFDENQADILLALKPKEQFFGYFGNGDFDLDKKTGTIFKSANPSHTYVGIQILHPRILKNLPEEECFSLSYFFDQALRNVRIKGFEVAEKAFHIGTVEAIKMVEEII